jgi:succinyl-diaminopimelate desuccinylase
LDSCQNIYLKGYSYLQEKDLIMKQHIFRQHGRHIKTVFPAVLALSLNHIPATSLADSEPAATDISPIKALLSDEFRTELDFLIGKETWRDFTELQENIVLENMGTIKAYLDAEVVNFNASQQNIKLRGFEWKQDRDNSPEDPMKQYWLFGYRIGSDEQEASRISLLAHMDTVPPGEPIDWDTKEPFVIHEIDKVYNDELTQFLVARGSIDDKGPGVVIFSVLRAVAKMYDSEGLPEGLAFEVLFDTSEETDMATPHYLNDTSHSTYRKPTMGIVYDGSWCVRAEKGIEGPTFTLPRQADPVSGLWIYDLDSEAGPVNQIPATATAVIHAESAELAQQFKDTVVSEYAAYGFDDPDYSRAELLEPEINDTSVTLVTRGSGAQHGSAPQENRANGSNPLVSLVNFLAYLVYEKDNDFQPNSVSRIAQFMKWGWGTKVFGEYHPDLLLRDDWVFEWEEGPNNGNGTTWSLTKLVTSENSITLDIDVRYAIGHHSTGYTGREGLLEGKSHFGEIIPQLVNRFHEENPGEAITMTTAFRFAPDIRAISNPNYIKINNAYKEIIGDDCPRLAIGGGTDAKGNNELIAAGALFTENLGPPINYHGIDEGAPLTDLEKGSKILYQLMLNEINEVKAKTLKCKKNKAKKIQKK